MDVIQNFLKEGVVQLGNLSMTGAEVLVFAPMVFGIFTGLIYCWAKRISFF